MQILITGGAGFIGSHLVRHLLAQGHHLSIVDDLSTGRRANIADLLGSHCTLLEGRVGQVLARAGVLEGIDQIYHLAAAVGVKLVVEEPVQSIETNVTQTTALLRAASNRRIPTLIASSSEVYGKSDRVPFREDDDVTYGATIYSRWSYAAAKAIDEYLALAHHRKHGLPVVVGRFFNTVGPAQVGHYGMVLPRFIEAALADRPLEIYGDGQQSRCFCHVGDVVETLPRLLANPACHGRIFNIGSDEEVSIETLADRVIALSGCRSTKKFIPYEHAYGQAFDDLRRRVPDLTRLRQAVGFQPTRNLDQIIQELITLGRKHGPGKTETK